VHSFETELLARDENLAGLTAINRALIAKVDAPQRVVLDLDSTEIPAVAMRCLMYSSGLRMLLDAGRAAVQAFRADQ